MITLKPERYYLGLYAISIPTAFSEHNKGGITIISPSCPLTDMTTWEVEFHFRHYNDAKLSKSSDTRRGFIINFRGKNPPEIKELIKDRFIPEMCGAAGAEVLEPFVIEGDNEKAFRLVAEGKHPKWFHATIESDEATPKTVGN